MAKFSASSLLRRHRGSNESLSAANSSGYNSELPSYSPSESECSSIYSSRDGSSTPRRDHPGASANNLDEQLASRLRALETSLRNPNLSPATRQFLEVAITSFEKTAAENEESLPPYTEDCRPPYEQWWLLQFLLQSQGHLTHECLAGSIW